MALDASYYFRHGVFCFWLAGGWWRQSSLKGNQSVGGRRKDAGGTQLFVGLEEFEKAERPEPGWGTLSKTLASETHLKKLLCDSSREKSGPPQPREAILEQCETLGECGAGGPGVETE